MHTVMEWVLCSLVINYDQYFSVMLKQRQVAAFKKHSKEIDLNKYVISKRKKDTFLFQILWKGNVWMIAIVSGSQYSE